jgi:hypothetical protein
VLALPLRQDLGEQIGAVATASKQVLLRLKATGYDTRTWDELFAKFDK